MEETKPYVITINRQLGCGGEYIGQQLASKLNIAFVDREIITCAAKELVMLEEDILSRDERVLSLWETFVTNITTSEHVSTPAVSQMLIATDDELFTAESRIITRLANEQSAVIMGRCGFSVLKMHPYHVSIFLHADKEFRNEKLQKDQGLMKSYVDDLIEKSDKQRAVYCKRFTGKDWTDARNYDISIDSSKMDVEEVVDMLHGFIKRRLKF